MQKYKVVASKLQKKYTLIISADNESEAKEKLHKDGYSILTIHALESSEISGKKFLFQIEKNGEIKNGIIVGEDIFKIYIKLVEDLEYNVISLYPEGDPAHTDAEKKQKILSELQRGYEIQKKNIKIKKEEKVGEETFYLKKRIGETSVLIEKVIEKMDFLLQNQKKFEIDEDSFYKLEKIYEKILHIKSSTNISKLQEVGELALIKIANIELQSLEKQKDDTSRKLLADTNDLLKKIGSDKKFIEKSKDYKERIHLFFLDLKKTFSGKELKEELKKRKKDQLIDKDSYNFLKTVLLLEKYKEKLSENKKQIQKKFIYLINPFAHNEELEKLLLKRKVIRQNISLLKAKKTGKIGSYTGVKKGFQKTTQSINEFIYYIVSFLFGFILFYFFLFFSILFLYKGGYDFLYLDVSKIIYILLLQFSIILFSFNKGMFGIFINIVFLSLFYIFSVINF